MNLNIQKAKIFVIERLYGGPVGSQWAEFKTRYGVSLIYTVIRWANTTKVHREFKVSFNTKSITIAEKLKGAWVPVAELDEKTCRQFKYIRSSLINFTPALNDSDSDRADRRTDEAFRALTGTQNGDVAVTVSAGADTVPTASSEPVKPPKTPMPRKAKGRPFPRVKQDAPTEAAYTTDGRTRFPDNVLVEMGAVAETPIGMPESAPVYAEPKFSPANHEQSVVRSNRESAHKIAMIKMVEESGIPHTIEPSKHGVSYLFEGISITFSGTMFKVAALTDWDEDKNERPYPVFTTWISGKYEHAQIDRMKSVLGIAKETARLRAMACFNMPEVSFGHSETNFVTDVKEPVRTRVNYISVYYRVDGFNHDSFDMVRVKSLRYTRDDVLEGVSDKGGNSEKSLTASVTYSRVTDGWGDRYYKANAPTKRMSIKCEEVSYTTNRDLLNSFGLKISAERRDEEYYIVNVPLDKVPVKA